MSKLNQKPKFKKVMVIDDSEADRYIASYNITKHNYAEEIILSETATHALEYLKQKMNTPEELPELIFLDIRMPEMDGFGFLDEYAKLPDAVKANCIIMMLSSSLDPKDLERAESSPFVNRFINKPLDKEKLKMLE